MVLGEKTSGVKKFFEEKRMDDIENWLRLEHPIPENQDGDCSKIEWMGLGYGSGVGDWKCLLQKRNYGDLGHGGFCENLDYLPCNSPDHNSCPVYFENFKE